MFYKRNFLFLRVFILCLLVISNEIPARSERELTNNIRAITRFIISEEFRMTKSRHCDLYQVDCIFQFAITQCNYDTSEALLALTFATLPYNRIPIKIPLTNIAVDLPIYSDEDSLFQIKNELLPSDFYLDTPTGKFKDNDKLAHFFGSAFLSYASTFIDLTIIIGYFVELIEVFFKTSDEADLRDMRTNELGKFFGTALRNGDPITPSSVFLLYNLNHALKYGIHLNH